MAQTTVAASGSRDATFFVFSADAVSEYDVGGEHHADWQLAQIAGHGGVFTSEREAKKAARQLARRSSGVAHVLRRTDDPTDDRFMTLSLGTAPNSLAEAVAADVLRRRPDVRRGLRKLQRSVVRQAVARRPALAARLPELTRWVGIEITRLAERRLEDLSHGGGR